MIALIKRCDYGFIFSINCSFCNNWRNQFHRRLHSCHCMWSASHSRLFKLNGEARQWLGVPKGANFMVTGGRAACHRWCCSGNSSEGTYRIRVLPADCWTSICPRGSSSRSGVHVIVIFFIIFDRRWWLFLL